MAEYIDREVFKKSVEEYYCKPCKAEGKDHNGCWCRACWVDDMLDEIDCFQPAADVAPVRHGRWLHTEEPLGWKDVDCMECSACHDSWIIEEDYCFDDMPLWNYCPSCGAKMDGGED